MALVPLWDMCNHGEDAGASRLAEDGSLELITTGVAVGEEVRMDYGDRSAANFLLHSGFVPPPSLREGADTATVDVALPATPLAALFARFLDSRNVPRAPAPPPAPPRWRGALLRMVATAGGAAHAARCRADANACGGRRQQGRRDVPCAPPPPRPGERRARTARRERRGDSGPGGGRPPSPGETPAATSPTPSCERDGRRGVCKGKTAR